MSFTQRSFPRLFGYPVGLWEANAGWISEVRKICCTSYILLSTYFTYVCFTCFFDLQIYVVVVFVCVVLFVSAQKWICKHLTVEIPMARLAVLNTTSKYGSLILWHATFWLRDVLRNIHKMATVVSQVVQVVMTDAFMIVDWCRLHNHCNDSKGVLHRKHDHRIYVRTYII